MPAGPPSSPPNAHTNTEQFSSATASSAQSCESAMHTGGASCTSDSSVSPSGMRDSCTKPS
eukprot:20737-Chlamydomonas_euryale.AAC.1